jgi:hypothetical protein
MGVHCPPGPQVIVDAEEGAQATASVLHVHGVTFDEPVGMHLPALAVDPLSVTPAQVPTTVDRFVQVPSGTDADPQALPWQVLILVKLMFGALHVTPVGLPHVQVHCAGSFEGTPPSKTGLKPEPHGGAPVAPVPSVSGPIHPGGTGGVHAVPTGHPASAPASKKMTGASVASLAEVVSAAASPVGVPVSRPPPLESIVVPSLGDCWSARGPSTARSAAPESAPPPAAGP